MTLYVIRHKVVKATVHSDDELQSEPNRVNTTGSEKEKIVKIRKDSSDIYRNADQEEYFCGG